MRFFTGALHVDIPTVPHSDLTEMNERAAVFHTFFNACVNMALVRLSLYYLPLLNLNSNSTQELGWSKTIAAPTSMGRKSLDVTICRLSLTICLEKRANICFCYPAFLDPAINAFTLREKRLSQADNHMHGR